MAIDLSFIEEKVSNNGATDAGRLTAEEFNSVLGAVRENQTSVNTLSQETKGVVKSIKFKGQTFIPDTNTGLLDLIDLQSGYTLTITESYGKTTIREGEDFIFEVTPFLTRPILNEETGQYEDVLQKDIILNVDFYYVTDFESKTVLSTKTNAGTPVSFNYKQTISSRDSSPYVYAKVTFTAEGTSANSGFVYPKVVYLDFSLSNFDNTQIKVGDWDLTVLTFSPDNFAPTIYVKIDDKSYSAVGDPGNSKSKTFHIEEALIGGGVSGVRSLEAYATLDVAIDSNVPELIESEHVYFDYIYVNPSETVTTPLIASSLNEGYSIQRYSNLSVPYWIYLADTVRTSVSLGLYNEDGTAIPGFVTTQEVSFTNNTSGLKTWSIALIGNAETLEGNKFIKISCGDSLKEIPITITKATLELTEADGYVAYFTAANRSNGEVDSEGNNIAANWENKNSIYSDIKMQFSENFKFVAGGSGWVTDEEGATSLHIKKGDFATLTFNPFIEDITWGPEKSTQEGLTFSVEFSTKNCVDKNAVVIDCLDENGKGFQVKANSAFISDGNDTYSCEYRENTRLRLDLVIDGKSSTYDDPTTEDPNRKWTESLAWIFVDGVYQLISNLKKDFSLKQLTPKNIVFGSEDCELDIYSIRIYKKPLDFVQVIQNYSFDAPVPSDKILIAQRNNLLTVDQTTKELTITENALQTARPELPILKFDMAEDTLLPVNKDDWIKMERLYFRNPTNSDQTLGMATFIGENSSMKNQGSSSMRYPAPYRNYDWKGKGFKFEDGTTGEKYKLFDQDPGIKKITFKKDYASSEMANNICCSELFTDMAAGLATDFIRCLSPTMEYAYRKASNNDTLKTYRLSLKGTPSFVYYKDSKFTTDTPLGMFNIIPNKSEVDYLGFVDEIQYFDDETKTYKADTLVIPHTHGGYVGGPEENNGNDYATIEGDANNYVIKGNIAQSWEIRDNFVFMEEILTPAHYVATYVPEEDENGDKVVDENGNTVYRAVYSLTENSSVWLQYEARYPKDSILHWKQNDKGEYEGDGDFGCHSENPVSPEEFEEDPNKYDQSVDLKKSRQECAEILDFHNWVASTNRKAATGLPLTELDKIYTGTKVFSDADLIEGSLYTEDLLKTFCEVDRDGNLIKNDDGSYTNKFARWADTVGLGYPGWKPSTIVMLNYSSKGDGTLDGYYDGSTVHTVDNVAYRTAKFIKEAEYHWNTSGNKWDNGGRLRLEQWLLYYIWMEQFWMMDSGSKNLQLYTMGRKLNAPETAPYEWGCMVRDADTGLGIDNEGKFMFPPYLEDTDFLKDKQAIADTDKFEFNTVESDQGSYSSVLNGQKGVMWKNLRDCFGGNYNSKMAEIYRALIKNSVRTNFGLVGDNNSLDKFDKHQENWCEALYNFGSKQYHGTKDKADWISSGLGNKKHQRKNWLYYGFRYRMSKYDTYKDTNRFSYKYESTESSTLNAYIYSPLYIRNGKTDGSLFANTYARHVDITKPARIHLNESDNTMQYLYDADLYTDLGNLYEVGGASNGFSSITFDGAGGSRLKSLRLGNRKDLVNYVNTKLSSDFNISPLVELQSLDLSSCIAMTGTLDIKPQIQLEEVFCENTKINNVSFPETSSLKTAWLPSTLGTLNVQNLPNLEEVTIGTHTFINDTDSTFSEDISSVKNLTVRDCPKLNINGVKVLDFLNKILDNGLVTVNINNINWNLNELSREEIVTFLDKVVNIPDLNLEGVIDISNREGALTYDSKLQLVRKVGNIDLATNRLYVKYNKTNLVPNSVTVPSVVFVPKVGETTLEFSVDNSVNDFEVYNNDIKMNWTISDTTYAEFKDPTKPILTVKSVGDGVNTTPSAKVTLTLYGVINTVKKEITVNFYEKQALPGDIVCADGSFYHPNEYVADENNPPIGVCYFVETVDVVEGETTKKKQLRLMAATKFTNGKFLSPAHANLPSGAFGPTASYNANDIANSSFDILSVEGLDGITSISKFENTGENPREPDSIIAVSNEKYTLNGRFVYTSESAGSLLTAQVGYCKVNETEATLLRDFGYKEGDYIPIGKKNTLLVLRHRNRVINYKNTVYTANGQALLEYPVESTLETELQSAGRLIFNQLPEQYNNDVPNEKNDGLLYFPVFTFADCFNPLPTILGTEERVIEKFREGNWFVPAAGDLIRIFYYSARTQGWLTGDAEKTIDGGSFDLAKTLGIASTFTGYIPSSSVTTSINTMVMINITNNGTYQSTALVRNYVNRTPIFCCEF